MSTKNSYPELPEIPYQHTTVDLRLVQLFARDLLKKYPKDCVVMAYAIFKNESANGLKGVNNNYGGVQADAGRWMNVPGKPIGTCVLKDNGGTVRRFLCFDVNGYQICLELFCIKAQQRNMKLARDYFVKWVGKSDPSPIQLKNFQAILDEAAKFFISS